jgi:hypothetical protein
MIFNAIEACMLGALVKKESTTPGRYRLRPIRHPRRLAGGLRSAPGCGTYGYNRSWRKTRPESPSSPAGSPLDTERKPFAYPVIS